MYVLFRYDPEALAKQGPERRKMAGLAPELGRIEAFFNRVSAYRSTRAAAATLAAVGFGMLEDGAHEMVINLQLHPALKAMADGCIVAACGGAVVWLILTGVSRRHHHTIAQQKLVAQLNGEICGELQVIVQASQTAAAHDRHTVINSVEQIEATLRRLSPSLEGSSDNKPPLKDNLLSDLASSTR